MSAVAGDFYDFLRPDEHHLGIQNADGSGHGVPAALIASVVKGAISAQLPHADDPAKVLAGMNQTLCGKLQGQFVTAAYLFIDLEERRIRYGAAGHPPLLWFRKGDRTVEPVVKNGLVLGLIAKLCTPRSKGRSQEPTASCCIPSDWLKRQASRTRYSGTSAFRRFWRRAIKSARTSLPLRC